MSSHTSQEGKKTVWNVSLRLTRDDITFRYYQAREGPGSQGITSVRWGIDLLIGSLTSADSRHISCQVSFSFGLLIRPWILELRGGREWCQGAARVKSDARNSRCRVVCSVHFHAETGNIGTTVDFANKPINQSQISINIQLPQSLEKETMTEQCNRKKNEKNVYLSEP